MLAATQLLPTLPILPTKAHLSEHVVHDHARSMEALLRDVQTSFESQLPIETLLSLSEKLQAEFKEHLVSSPQCMLPSHNYVLPTGKERGTYLALEVGGSTLRVALVDLDGRKNGKPSLKIRRSENSPVTMAVRKLEGLEFFDWIAARIREMLAMDKEAYNRMLSKPLRMGVAWAFPIEYVYMLLPRSAEKTDPSFFSNSQPGVVPNRQSSGDGERFPMLYRSDGARSWENHHTSLPARSTSTTAHLGRVVNGLLGPQYAPRCDCERLFCHPALPSLPGPFYTSGHDPWYRLQCCHPLTSSLVTPQQIQRQDDACYQRHHPCTR